MTNAWEADKRCTRARKTQCIYRHHAKFDHYNLILISMQVFPYKGYDMLFQCGLNFDGTREWVQDLYYSRYAILYGRQCIP